MESKFVRWSLAALYALCGLPACVSLAFWSAVALVEHRHVSNFEGGSGYAAMFQLPLWLLLYAAILIAIYLLWLRKRTWLLAVATVLLVFLAMPAISLVAQLALDMNLPAGPLGRIE
jgi:hypothetical protein